MRKPITMPPVKQDYYALGGGLDLMTPSIALEPGKLIDSQNYEPSIAGGYRRINGFERTDGRASATAQGYWIIPMSFMTPVPNGTVVNGATSGATGVVLGLFGTNLVLGRVTGAFVAIEGINNGPYGVGISSGPSLANSALMPSDHADYMLLAANDWRAQIGPVPGSGPIRGVWIYNDVLYAFRDNAGATANIMWKATASGWVQVPFFREIRFISAVSQVNAGTTVTGSSSGATALVLAANLQTGTWTSNGVGSLVVTNVVGNFSNGETLNVGATAKVNVFTSTQITRSPGGRCEFFNYNFTGSTNSTKMYGVDGVNTAFEFDGTIYAPIRTGMTPDTPSHVIAHKGFLFLSFMGSVQYSGLGLPFAWTVVLGAGEIDLSSTCTGFLPQGGNINGSSLAIFTSERTFVLYGSSNADFKLVSSIFDQGYFAYTCQQVSNDAYGMTARGIQALMTTLNYGDFDYSSVSHLIQPLITAKRGMECASNTVKEKNQYRVYYTDGTALAVGLTGNSVTAITLLNYSMPVRCIVSTTLSTGQEVTYFGSDNGYVYMDNVGTSQDGNPIQAWARLPFNNNKSPRIKKRWRRAVLEVQIEGYSEVNISYDLGYGNPDVQPSAPISDQLLIGAGGYWDQFTWDNFVWDAAYNSSPSISLEGTEKNISMIFYSNRAQDNPHVLNGITLISSFRVLER